MVNKIFGNDIEFKCKILPYGNFASLVFGLNIAMVILFVGIYIGLPTIVNVILLIGVLFFIFSFISNDATFTLSQFSLTKTLEDKNFLFKNKPKISFFWSDVKSYKQGTDRGKYRGEIAYLEIKFLTGEVWKVTDMYGERKAEFDEYQTYFLEAVNKINQSNSTNRTPESTQPKISIITSNDVLIKREKTFYETIFGKLFTILLGITIVAIFSFSLSLNRTSWFKLDAVLIPGFVYMVYRTFIKKYP